jgi:hypothetical protein
MDKAKVEKMCRRAGCEPVMRGKIGGFDILIADGFSIEPHKVFHKFGVSKGDFLLGCYATFWWAFKDEKMHIGCPLFFEALHDAAYDRDIKQQMRINSAMENAELHIVSEQRVSKRRAFDA